MNMDCSKSYAACRSDCCHGPVPMRRDFWERQVPVRPAMYVVPMAGGMVAPVASYERDGKTWGVCPLLGLDGRCSVYEQRPPVCRKFGDETSDHMTCSFQAADGRIRSRQERRRVEQRHRKREATTARHIENGTVPHLPAERMASMLEEAEAMRA